MEKNVDCVSAIFHCKNPARIPNVVGTIRKFSKGAFFELACLRQLSQLYYETFSSNYFDVLNKSITFESKVEEDGKHSRRLDEFPYIYRRIIARIVGWNPNILDFDLAPTSILPYITSIELSLCQYQKVVNTINFSSFGGEEESIKFAVQLCRKYLIKLKNLKTLDIKYAESGGKFFASELIPSLPQNIQINLYIQKVSLISIYNLIQHLEQNQCTPTNLSLHIDALYFDGACTLGLDYWETVLPCLQKWIEVSKSRLEAIRTFGGPGNYRHEPESMCFHAKIWKCTGLIFIPSDIMSDPYPLSHQRMRHQISKLHLMYYSRPLNFIRNMPRLKILILEQIDIYACLVPELELTYKENLNAIFDGLKHLKVKLIRNSEKPGYDKITPGNPVAEYIGTLVRKFQPKSCILQFLNPKSLIHSLHLFSTRGLFVVVIDKLEKVNAHDHENITIATEMDGNLFQRMFIWTLDGTESYTIR